MDSLVSFNTTIWTMAVNISFLIGTIWLLRKGNASIVLQGWFGVISIIWLVVIYYITINQVLIPESISGTTFYLITLAAATLVLLFFNYSSLKGIFDKVRQEDIQWVQGIRVFVAAGFLMEGVVNVIPGWFSIMDGFMHVTSGFLALIAAIALLKELKNRKQMLWLANIVGLVDIVIIVTSINFLVWEDIGPFHNMQTVVFYTGVVLLWLHFVSITKLVKGHSTLNGRK